MTENLYPGFADPVRDSQAVFRAVLDAMSRPGRIHTVPGPAEPPPPLDIATAAALLTLVDAETSLWLDEFPHARNWLKFHCGAQFSAKDQADFAVTLTRPDLIQFKQGTEEEPETSATVIVQVARLGEGSGFRLDGPGLAETAFLFVDGLGEHFIDQWRASARLFPRGVDVILAAGNRLAALPRTVRLEPI